MKGIQERFARLGVVASILRSQEGRERSVIVLRRLELPTLTSCEDMTSFIKMGYRVGVGPGTIILVSVRASGCVNDLASS